MQKKTLRAVCMILSVLMVVPMLFACGKPAETNKDEGTNTDVVTQEKDVFNDPKTTYDGDEFRILTAGHVAYMDFGFEAEEESIPHDGYRAGNGAQNVTKEAVT